MKQNIRNSSEHGLSQAHKSKRIFLKKKKWKAFDYYEAKCEFQK